MSNHEATHGLAVIRGFQEPFPRLPLYPVPAERPNQNKYNHWVLYIVNPKQEIPEPYERRESDRNIWDAKNFVKLPCSPHNQVIWSTIKQVFDETTIKNSEDLERAIKTYNSDLQAEQFTSLHALFNNQNSRKDEVKAFFDDILPKIIDLALLLPDIVKAPIPLLKQGENRSLSLSKKQISCLLANAFLCTFPDRHEYKNYPFINFNRLFRAEGDDVLGKLRCIINYFKRVCNSAPIGVMTFIRSSVDYKDMPHWSNSNVPVAGIPIFVDAVQSIERCDGIIHLDFANKYLGGGVLGHGSVQEEIRFVTSPELLVSKLFTEVMRENEAVMMIGSERYNLHIGYSRNFEWSGNYKDDAYYDDSHRRCSAVLAIDAKLFHSKKEERKLKNIDRELNKAWVGFSMLSRNRPVEYPGVATGNWGCGAFGGTPQLKSLIQLMACAEARRPMAYMTFGDESFKEGLEAVYQHLQQLEVTVGSLYRTIIHYANGNEPFSKLFDYLLNLGKWQPPEKAATTSSQKPTQLSTTDLLHEQLNSPDLFSQDELSKEDKEQITKQIDCISKIEQVVKKSNDDGKSPEPSLRRKRRISDSDDEEHKNASKMAATENNKESRTSVLFKKLQKFDDCNGKLNLSVAGNSRNSLALNTTAIDNATAIDNDIDVSPEVNKSLSRKITDYFSKINKKPD